MCNALTHTLFAFRSSNVTIKYSISTYTVVQRILIIMVFTPPPSLITQVKQWVPVALNETYIFLALFLLVGIINKPSILRFIFLGCQPQKTITKISGQKEEIAQMV